MACSLLFEGVDMNQLQAMAMRAAQGGGQGMHDHGGDDYGDEDMPMGQPGQNPAAGGGGDAVNMLQNFASNPMFR